MGNREKQTKITKVKKNLPSFEDTGLGCQTTDFDSQTGSPDRQILHIIVRGPTIAEPRHSNESESL